MRSQDKETILRRLETARTLFERHLLLDEAWLEQQGFEQHGTHMGLLVDASKGSIVEVTLTPATDGWYLSLLQDSDHVTITSKVYRKRSELRSFLDAIGASR